MCFLKSSVAHSIKYPNALEGCFEIECVLGFVLVCCISVFILNYTDSQYWRTVKVNAVKVFSKQLERRVLLCECFSFFSPPLLLAPKGMATAMGGCAPYYICVKSLSSNFFLCMQKFKGCYSVPLILPMAIPVPQVLELRF